MKTIDRVKVIAVLLMLVCMQTAVVAVIPHHHHHHEICLADDFDEEHGDSDDDCEDVCITHFKAICQQRISELINLGEAASQLTPIVGLWADVIRCESVALAETPRFALVSFPLTSPPYAGRLFGRAPPV